MVEGRRILVAGLVESRRGTRPEWEEVHPIIGYGSDRQAKL